MIETSNQPQIIAKPVELSIPEDEWTFQYHDAISEIAVRVHEYYVAKANAMWGHHLGEHEDFNPSITIERMTPSIVGLARGRDKILINTNYLNDCNHQWATLTETIAHEVAHCVFISLWKSRLFKLAVFNGVTATNSTHEERVAVLNKWYSMFGNKRVTWHGKFWKFLFCELANLKKVNNRFFGQITR